MHTKGPWTVNEGSSVFFIDGEDRERHPIAVVDKWDDVDKANAYLIAAVTDLLEACKAVRDEIVAFSVLHDISMSDRMPHMMELINKAIAKVEGTGD